MDTQLGARHRRRTPMIHRGRAQRTMLETGRGWRGEACSPRSEALYRRPEDFQSNPIPERNRHSSARRSGQPHSLPCRTMAWTRVWHARLAATVRPRKLPCPSIGGVSPDWPGYAIIKKALFRNGQGTRTSGWMWELPRRCRSSGRSEPWFRCICSPA